MSEAPKESINVTQSEGGKETLNANLGQFCSSDLRSPPAPFRMAMESSTSSENDNLSITVERNPSESRLSELGIKSWPKWGCPPGKFPLKFDAQQTCYLLRGKVKAYKKGSSEFVEFGAGDLVTIPKGFSCTWDVSVAVDKHYKFDSS